MRQTVCALVTGVHTGALPIYLFCSRSFRRGETELVIVVTPYLVKPVNDSDIKLPTDGFRAANELQAFIGYRENAGVSGEARPGPTASDKDAPPPAVSAYDPAAIVPGEQPTQRQAQDKPRKKDRRAEVATPGFSF